MNKDQLFAKAIQNIATKELALVKSTNKNFDFSLVENIFNHLENYILMMSVGRWLAKQLPKGWCFMARFLKVEVTFYTKRIPCLYLTYVFTVKKCTIFIIILGVIPFHHSLGPEKAKVVKRIVDRIAQILKNNTEKDPNVSISSVK